MSRRLLAATPALALALSLAACGSSDDSAEATETVTVTDARGDHQVPVNPDSVVVFDLGVLDTLDTLGVDAVTGVPQSNLPDSLKKYRSDEYANVGDVFEPDLEAIPATEPDVIIVGGRSSQQYDTLASTFSKAVVLDISVDESDYFASLSTNARELAKIFGKEDAADDAIADLEKRIEDVKPAAQSAGDGLVVLTSGGEVTAYSVGSRFGVLHEVFGVPNATGQLGDAETRHGQSIGFEFIQSTNPDHLFVVDRDAAIGQDGEAAAQVLDNELVHSTTAAQHNNIHYLDPGAWYLVVGGLSSFSTMLDDVEEAVA